LIESNCPICAAHGLSFLQVKDCNRRISPKIFLYHKCTLCGFIYLVNVPEDLGAYYPNIYYDIPKDRESLLASNAHDQYKLGIVQQFIKKGRLLEIGPAFGSFSCTAKQAGFDVEVIEMDERCCHFIQTKLGIKAVQANNPIEALIGLSAYDVITLWQVIEHLPEPFLVLKAIVDKLLPGGTLVISTPNPAAFQFWIMGRFWAHLDAPRHLTLIPSDLLIDQMKAMGLECVLLTTTDKGSMGWDSFGWAVSLRNFFLYPPLQHAAHLAGRLLTKLLIPIERSSRRGSAYTAIFQKKRG